MLRYLLRCNTKIVKEWVNPLFCIYILCKIYYFNIMTLLEDFKKYLIKVKKRYEECKDEKERKSLAKKIADYEDLIARLERFKDE